MKTTVKKEVTIKTSAAILLILFVIFAFLIYDFRTVQVKQAKQQMNKTINNLAFKINNQNQRMISLVDMMANYQQVSGFAKRAASIDYLFELVKDKPQVLGAAYCYEPNADGQDQEYRQSSKRGIDSQGRFVPYVVRKSTMQQEEIILTQVKELDKSFYQQPKESRQTIITEPFNYQGTMMVTYVTPLIINDQFVGVAAVDRSLQQIQNYLHSLNSFATAEFYLVSPDNKVIATSQSKTLLGQKFKEDNLQYQPSVAEIEDKFVVSAPIAVGQWKLIMSIDKKEALENVNQLTRNMMGLGVLAVILLSVFLYYLIYKSLRPISAATMFAQNLAAENFNITDLEIKAENEIGQLSRVLNKMKDKLHTKIIKTNRVNRQLAEEKNKLQKYLNIAEVMFIVLNDKQEVKLINDKGAKVLGLEKEEIIGQNLIDNFIPKEDRSEVKAKAEQLFRGQQELVTNFETTMITEQGDERIIIWNCTVLKDEQGQVCEILNSGIDITKRRLLQEELEYNKLKTQFFANLSHEFKTPLNLIFSALQMLEFAQQTKSDSSSEQGLGKYTAMIKQNSYRLLRLVNNLVDITRINANSFELNFSNYDIVALLKNITLSVQEYVENKNRQLSFKTEVKTEIMACDFFSLERIMLNLISNAVKFTAEGDKIAVNLKKRADKIIITVADTGVGIPTAKQEAIFKQFRQVNKSFTRSHEGSGIGLSLVKSLVELHEGQIKVNSTVGVGSEFIIELPIIKLDESEMKDKRPEDLFERIELEFADIDRD